MAKKCNSRATMKRLYFIVEGQTEKEFIHKSVRKHLNNFGIFDISVMMIQTSKGNKGGFVNYQHLKNDILKILKSEKNIIVTTFVDYFKIPNSTPNFDKILNISDTNQKISILEKGIFDDINDNRLLPYIQKHEFESLLFSNEIGFFNWFENQNVIDELSSIIKEYDNPEDINSRQEFAPSKRIIKILSNFGEKYDKVAEGNLIAEEIGIDVILQKCPRFNQWLMNLIEILKK